MGLGMLRCGKGLIGAGEAWPFSAVYADHALNLTATPPGERWTLLSDFRQGARTTLTLVDAKLKRLAPFIPDSMPRLQGGTVNATMAYEPHAGTPSLRMNAAIAGLSFADAKGERAGEKIAAELRFEASLKDATWQWTANLLTRSGEVYWRPLYSAFNGQTLGARGSLAADRITIDQVDAGLPGIGAARGALVWDRAKHQLRSAQLDADKLKLAPAYTSFLQPMLEKSLLGKLKMTGDADISWRYRDAQTVAFDLRLRDANIEQTEGRFRIDALNATVPWRLTEPTQATVSARSGEFFKIPLGAVRLPIAMKGHDLRIENAAIPVLDGKLQISDFHGVRLADQWQWQFSGGLAPISMERLTQRMGWPAMHGTIAGVIPRVTYSERAVNVEGALLVKVFDGTIVAKGLTIADPAGRVPILKADLDMRNLDLDLLTRTFSFGNIQGRIDADIVGLELAKSKPIAFNAQLRSSPGKYTKRISQRAVQNISALGGGGGAAAIVQRGFLGFFKEFGYDKIGLSCRLHNGICTMDGVEDTPSGFVIIKGSGIPAITVIGYNRQVEFSDLVDRLAAVVQNNEKPIVK